MKRVGFAAILVSCGSHNAPEPPPQTDLEIVSPGFVPREVIRYALATGTRTLLSFDVEGRIAAGELGATSPSLHIELELAVNAVLPDGRMKLTSTITSVTAASPTAAQADAGSAVADGPPPSLAPGYTPVPAPAATPEASHVDAAGAELAGLAITATLSPDGHVADVATSDKPLPAAAKAELSQVIGSFQHLAMPLPATPVGIGARWRSTRELGPATSLALQAATIVDLVGRSGPTLTFAVSSRVHGADQAAVMDGVTVDVRDIIGTATSASTLDLTRFRLDTTESAELHTIMTIGSDATPMIMTQTLRVTSR